MLARTECSVTNDENWLAEYSVLHGGKNQQKRVLPDRFVMTPSRTISNSNKKIKSESQGPIVQGRL